MGSRENLARRAVSCLLACALAACMAVPFAAQEAQAAVNFGQVQVSLPGSAALTTGQSASVACTLSPASHQQTPNCTTDYCPSGCDFASGGCQNADGQCTCFGTSYSPYYASATVSSSNPSVARATYASGVVTVAAYAAGTATITVYGDLRLWTTGTATMTVTVSDPAPAPAPEPNEPSGGSSGGQTIAPPASGTGSGSGSGSGAGSGGGVAAGSVSVTDAGVTSTSSTGRVLSALVAGGDAAKVEEGADSVEEGKVSLVRIGDAAVADALAAVAGTDETVCFWEGDSIEDASYLWSFAGQDLSADDVAEVDLGVTDATADEPELADALGDATYCALAFAHDGAYPAPATFGYRVSDLFANGERLALYFYDRKSESLVLVQQGVEVSEGYATFKIDHGSTWVLADDDQLAGPLAREKAEPAEPRDASGADDGAALDAAQAGGDGFPAVAVGLGAAAVLAVAVAAGLAVRRRKKAAAAGETEGAQGAAGEDGPTEQGEPTAAATAQAEETDNEEER